MNDETTEHQHYAKPTQRPIHIGDETTCDGCGATFTVAIVWAA